MLFIFVTIKYEIVMKDIAIRRYVQSGLVAIMMLLYCHTISGHSGDYVEARFTTTDLSNLGNIEVTYLVVGDVNSPDAQRYFKVLKENWTLSPKVELINEDQQYTKVFRNALFISGALYNPRMDARGISFWSYTDKAIKKPQVVFTKSSGQAYFNVDAGAEMYYQESLRFDVNKTRPDFYKGFTIFEASSSSFFLWGDGFFKSRLLLFQRYAKLYLNNPDKKAALRDTKEITNEAELKKLKSGTLYIPDEFLCSYNMFNDKTDCHTDEKKILGMYPAKYTIITGKELNNKLMNDIDTFFYANCLLLRDNVLVLEIVNSKTGEVIFSRKYAAFFFEKKMCADLANAIN